MPTKIRCTFNSPDQADSALMELKHHNYEIQKAVIENKYPDLSNSDKYFLPLLGNTPSSAGLFYFGVHNDITSNRDTSVSMTVEAAEASSSSIARTLRTLGAGDVTIIF